MNQLDGRTIKVRPGFLVVLNTSVKGGVTYHRQDLEDRENADGAHVHKWETEKIVSDPEEHETACAIRLKVRSLVRAACYYTPFGHIVPTDEVENLDAKLAEARQLVDEFNADAKTCRVRFSLMRGEIAEDAAEAVSAVADEVKDLMEQMQGAIAGGKVGDIRNIANRANTMSRLLEAESEGKDHLSRAVRAARKIARAITKRVQNGSEDMAAVLAEQEAKPIAMARFQFDPQAPNPKDETSEDGPALPAVALARFAGLK